MSGLILWPGDPELAVIEYQWSIHQMEGGSGSNALVRLIAGDSESPTTDPRDSRSLVRPYGVYVDALHRMYVTDTGAARVSVIDLPTGKAFSFYEAGPRELKTPLAVVADGEGQIFVADGAQGAVFIFDRSGKYLHSLESGFERPVGLALDESLGRLYVSDSEAHTVYGFSRDGKLVSTLGGRGTAAGQFNYPTHLYVNSRGELYVCDALNFRIQVFGRDGTYITSFGQLGDLMGNLERPKGVAVDGDGNIYVVDAIQDTVKMFDREGRLLLYFGEKGNNLGQFWLPSGIYIDREDTIYVADTYHGRVAAFKYRGRD